MTLLRHLTIAVLVSAAMLPAQRRVDPRNSFYRVIAVVPLVAGANGAAAWPKYVPTAPPAGSSAPSIIAFASEISDDGQHAVIELVAQIPRRWRTSLPTNRCWRSRKVSSRNSKLRRPCAPSARISRFRISG